MKIGDVYYCSISQKDFSIQTFPCTIIDLKNNGEIEIFVQNKYMIVTNQFISKIKTDKRDYFYEEDLCSGNVYYYKTIEKMSHELAIDIDRDILKTLTDIRNLN